MNSDIPNDGHLGHLGSSSRGLDPGSFRDCGGYRVCLISPYDDVVVYNWVASVLKVYFIARGTCVTDSSVLALLYYRDSRMYFAKKLFFQKTKKKQKKTSSPPAVCILGTYTETKQRAAAASTWSY
jgi:hypothetical protein